MPILDIYIRDKSTDRNKACIIITYLDNYNERSVVAKNLRHRGTNDNIYASRECTKEEMDNETSNPYRIEYIKYNDWDNFLNDEIKYNDSDEWISKLNNLKKMFPEFDKKGQLTLKI